MKTPILQESEPEKLDLLKLHKADYQTPKRPILLEIRPASYLAIEGEGRPEDGTFECRIGALYAMAYTIKMTRRFLKKQDYCISKLETIYLNLGEKPCPPPEAWRWKLLIRSPDFLEPSDLESALAALKKRGKEGDSALVRLERISEGTCVQMLHVGPYDKECETIALMESFARSKKLRLHGAHHEIYISDPRRVEPAKLKTILRHPVRAET